MERHVGRYSHSYMRVVCARLLYIGKDSPTIPASPSTSRSRVWSASTVSRSCAISVAVRVLLPDTVPKCIVRIVATCLDERGSEFIISASLDFCFAACGPSVALAFAVNAVTKARLRRRWRNRKNARTARDSDIVIAAICAGRRIGGCTEGGEDAMLGPLEVGAFWVGGEGSDTLAGVDGSLPHILSKTWTMRMIVTYVEPP